MIRRSDLTATYQGICPIPLNGKHTGNDMGGKWEFSGFSSNWEAKKSQASCSRASVIVSAIARALTTIARYCII